MFTPLKFYNHSLYSPSKVFKIHCITHLKPLKTLISPPQNKKVGCPLFSCHKEKKKNIHLAIPF